MRSTNDSGYNITVRTTLCVAQLQLVLTSSDHLILQKPTLVAITSFPFKSTSTSPIWTRTFMAHLTLRPSIIAKVGTEFVNPTGTFSNPIVTFFTTPFCALMCPLTQFTLMLALIPPSFVTLSLVIWPHWHNATFIPHGNYPPLTKKVSGAVTAPIFFFYTNVNGPLWGVMSRHLCNSVKILNPHPTCLFQPS